MKHRRGRKRYLRARRYLVAGILTAVPIWVTWLVFDFLIGQLSQLGAPWVRALGRALKGPAPAVADVVLAPLFQGILAVAIILVLLCALGWLTTRVLGRRLLALFEGIVERIPLAQHVYGGSKKLVGLLQQRPNNVQRVVLIHFPSRDMKAVGFVTRTFQDADTGEDLAAVYVPTTPNPTSGYMEIVPITEVTSTDWTLDEAFQFVISAGAITPDEVNYRRDRGAAPHAAEPDDPRGEG